MESEKEQPQGENRGNPLARLKGLLKFDASKPARLSSALFTEVVEGIHKTRLDAAKIKATELLTKAIGLQEQKVAADRAYEKQSKQFDKELGGILGQIQQMLDGVEPKQDEPEPAA